jgi:hypothetical protein
MLRNNGVGVGVVAAERDDGSSKHAHDLVPDICPDQRLCDGIGVGVGVDVLVLQTTGLITATTTATKRREDGDGD